MTDAEEFPQIGVGGWAYLPGERQNKLKVCSKLYDFVELNSSFYKRPPIALAKKWRSSVDENFEFSIRASRRLTHVRHLEPTDENYSEYAKNLEVCRVLRAFILHFQFPPNFEVTKDVIAKWRNFVSTTRREREIHLAFEVRNEASTRNPALWTFMDDHDIIPVGDPFRNEIKVSSDSKIQYSRVFGPGEHTKWSFSTSELEDLKDKVVKTPAKKRYVTFHNMTMYEDGARMRSMVRTGGSEPHPPVSGIESLREALVAERISYPTSSAELSARLAWRTVATPDGVKIHPDEVTRKVPGNVRFDSLDQVLQTFEPLFAGQPG
jgi:uncharacterized protein YecE (DUF72 family)